MQTKKKFIRAHTADVVSWLRISANYSPKISGAKTASSLIHYRRCTIASSMHDESFYAVAISDLPYTISSCRIAYITTLNELPFPLILYLGCMIFVLPNASCPVQYFPRYRNFKITSCYFPCSLHSELHVRKFVLQYAAPTQVRAWKTKSPFQTVLGGLRESECAELESGHHFRAKEPATWDLEELSTFEQRYALVSLGITTQAFFQP